MCKMMLSEHVAERTSWTLKIDDDGVLTFPQDLLDRTGWREGDVLDWKDLGNGSWSLTKKSV
jgi:bifunctional DNA-binding transcriptional regulator/antitoxin component of YhaV-PrlF toxin-antitoxin module